MDLSLQQIIDGIRPIDRAVVAKAEKRTAQLVMPPRALGRLHAIGERLCGMQGTLRPVIAGKAVLVMAGDHGVVAEGVSAFPQEEYALRAFKLGASGYVSKESASDEVLVAVRKALAGGRYVTPLLAEKLAATLSGETPVTPHETLSNRELEVLRLIAAGKTIKEAAAELNLSEKTIGTYRLRLSKKMGLSTNVELARYALQHKLVD